jgi:ABC-type transport system substrate-binding protein
MPSQFLKEVIMRFLTTGLIILTAIFSFSCTKKVDLNEKVLNLAVTAEIKGMDPIYANDMYSSNEVARVYEGLLQYHYLKRPYTLVPNLAEEMPTVSKDSLTYTFKIRKGVLFHDDAAFPKGLGRELVAQDFVYSIKRLADPKLQSLGWWLLQGKLVGLDDWRKKYAEKDKVDYGEVVEGVKALDKYTLQFKLKKSFPQFLYALAMPFTYAVAKEVVDKYGKEFLNHPVGTGPFILPVFTQSNKITYTKNPKFRDKYYPAEASEEFNTPYYLADAGKKLPLVNKIVVNIMKEQQPRWLNFQKGKLDVLGIPKDNFDTAVTPDRGLTDQMAKKGIELIKSINLDVTYIAFNHDDPLFKNVHLRRAMSMAYDPVKSNKLFYNNLAVVAQSLVPPGIAGQIKGYTNPYVGPNIEGAKKMLAKAGYGEGLGLPEITYDTASATISRQMGEFFKKQMALIGIKVKVVTNPWPQLQEKITKRKVQVFGIAWGADYPDAENFLQLLYGPNRAPGANGSGYDNPEFNRLFEVSSLMQDSPERTALYEKMYRIAAEQMPWIFGVHRQNFILRHGFLKNYVASDFDQGSAQYLNIDLKKKAEILKKL